MNRFVRLGYAVFIGAAIAATSTCCLAYTGRVIDGTTGKPAAGIYVIGRWETGGGFVVPSSGCVVAITIANAKGEFTLHGGNGVFGALLGPSSRPAISFYKQGYVRDYASPEEGDTLVVVPDTRPTKKRLAYLLQLDAEVECGSLDEQKEKSMSLYRAILEEATDIAKDKEDLRYLNGVMYRIDVLQVGYEQARRQADIRRRQWGLE